MVQTYSSTIRRKEMDAVLTCMVDEKIGPGDMNLRLVQYVKEFFGVDGAVALRSPSIALKYVLVALDLPKECGIIISALAPAWQYHAVVDLGYKPMIVDVSVDSALVVVEQMEDAIKNGGRLILLSETFGSMPDMEAVLALGIPVVEDVSQSVGAFYETSQEQGEMVVKKAGTYGTFAIMGLEERDLVTCGGGAVLMAPSRREWIVLKRLVDMAPSTDVLPDINSALAFVQLKEFNRNETVRQELFAAFQKALMSGRHKTFSRIMNGRSAVCSFPVVLDSGYKDVRQYAAKKGIEIQNAFEGSVVCLLQDSLDGCVNAKSLLLRCAVFPLYPRLGSTQVSSIVKVLGTLP